MTSWFRLLSVVFLIVIEFVCFIMGINTGFFNHQYPEACFYLLLSIAAQISIVNAFRNDDIKEIKEKLKDLEK